VASGDHLQQVAAAFSRKAGSYDVFGEGHENLARMREKVYRHVESVMLPGGYLLELNAGTGADAVELVRRGFRVHATDIASEMVSEIEGKIDCFSLHDRLTVQECSFTMLGEVRDGPYDGIFSNAGGLNCIADLTPVIDALPRLLRAGGLITWVIMPRFCPWEVMTAIKDPRTGLRRLRGQTVATVEGIQFDVSYFGAREVIRAFGPAFRRVRLEGLLVTVPPADNNTFAVRYPGVFRGLTMVDDLLSPLPPFNRWGDFFILTMRYAP
jgi:ubiquinone/menaquinone biosynthesis C-methylase UbiE